MIVERYAYTFGYNTPSQLQRNQQFGWDDEDSATMFIRAPNEDAALAWGRSVAEVFIKRLFANDAISWREQGFADRIDLVRLAGNAQAQGLPEVEYGEYPDWDHFPSA